MKAPSGRMTKNYGVLPSREAFDAIIRGHTGNTGPLVLDIERLPLKGSTETVHRHLRVLATLADWARADVPGKIVGYYGSGTLTDVPTKDMPSARELARHVDAFFPPMYTFDDNRHAWAKRAKAEAAEDRVLAPGKPVFFYLWPQYHDGTPKQFQYVDGAFWKFQLHTGRRAAEGIVLWSPSRFNWDQSSGWWTATQEFMRLLHPPDIIPTQKILSGPNHPRSVLRSTALDLKDSPLVSSAQYTSNFSGISLLPDLSTSRRF
jgi:hypothetical protein